MVYTDICVNCSIAVTLMLTFFYFLQMRLFSECDECDESAMNTTIVTGVEGSGAVNEDTTAL